jgi:hypothetical protein
MAVLLGAGAVLLAAFVKGGIGFGFPTLGTPLLSLVIDVKALALPKHEFVAAVAFTFVVYKLVQLGAVTYYGLLSWFLLGLSVVLTVVALAGFAVGVRVQDRLEQRTFNRMVLGILGSLGVWLVIRSLW